MSLHIKSSPEAEARYKSQRRNSTIASLIIGLLIIVLLGMILWAIAIPYLTKRTEAIVTYNTTTVVAETVKKKEIVHNVVKKPTQAASSSAVKITTAVNSTSSFSVKTPDIAVKSLSLDFGVSEGFESGWGSLDFGASPDSGAFTLFGKVGGKGLIGNFYDCKIDKEREMNALGISFQENRSTRVPVHKALLTEFIDEDFSEKVLAPYYKAKQSLSFTHLIMGAEPATVAPEAFNVQDEVTATGWIVVYEGIITPPKNKKYRFVGVFDDILLVFINGKIVFDGSYSAYSPEYFKGEAFKGTSIFKHRGMRQSPYVSIKSGDKLRIVIGETPGGSLGGGLLVQEEGKEYELCLDGSPKLPPFSTEKLTKEQKERLSNMNRPLEVDDVPIFIVK